MRFSDPASIIYNTFPLESTRLKCNIWRMFQDHIRTCSYTCYIFKILPHQTVSTSRVGCIHYRALLYSFLICKARLLSKEMRLDLLVTSDIFWTQESQQLIQVYCNVTHINYNSLVFERIARKLFLKNLLESIVRIIDSSHGEPTELFVAVELA